MNNGGQPAWWAWLLTALVVAAVVGILFAVAQSGGGSSCHGKQINIKGRCLPTR